MLNVTNIAHKVTSTVHTVSYFYKQKQAEKKALYRINADLFKTLDDLTFQARLAERAKLPAILPVTGNGSGEASIMSTENIINCMISGSVEDALEKNPTWVATKGKIAQNWSAYFDQKQVLFNEAQNSLEMQGYPFVGKILQWYENNKLDAATWYVDYLHEGITHNNKLHANQNSAHLA